MLSCASKFREINRSSDRGFGCIVMLWLPDDCVLHETACSGVTKFTMSPKRLLLLLLLLLLLYSFHPIAKIIVENANMKDEFK